MAFIDLKRLQPLTDQSNCRSSFWINLEEHDPYPPLSLSDPESASASVDNILRAAAERNCVSGLLAWGRNGAGTVFFLLGGIKGRTLAARRPLSAMRGFVRRAALVQEPTGRSTTLAHQIQNFFPGETRIDARHVQR